MTKSTNVDGAPQSPIEPLLSSRVIVIANLLRRGATLRYRRLLGLSSVEFGIVAMLGGRSPTPVGDLAALLGMDKAQVSRALRALTAHDLVARSADKTDSRQVLIALTATGRRTHAVLIETAERVNERLADGLSRSDLARLDEMLDALKGRAEALLAEETMTR